MKYAAYDKHLLLNNYLFLQMNDVQITTLLESMKRIVLEEGEILFHLGESAKRFFLLETGQIKLYRVSADGNEKVMELLQPGQTFAEAVMFMKKQDYPVTASAIESSKLLSFDNKVFLQLLRDSTDTCFRLMADMSQRLHQRLNEIDDLALQNATYRLVRYLLQQLQAETGTDLEIELQSPKHIIASRLSIKPETFSRILHKLSNQDIIRVTGKHIHVKDINRLRLFEH